MIICQVYYFDSDLALYITISDLSTIMNGLYLYCIAKDLIDMDAKYVLFGSNMVRLPCNDEIHNS